MARRRAASCGSAVSRTMARPITSPAQPPSACSSRATIRLVHVAERTPRRGRPAHRARAPPSAPAGGRSDRTAARRRAGRPRGRRCRRSSSSACRRRWRPASRAASGRAGTKMCMASVPLKVISVSSQSGAVTPRPRRRRRARGRHARSTRIVVSMSLSDRPARASLRIAARHRLDLVGDRAAARRQQDDLGAAVGLAFLALDQAGRLEIVEQAHDRGIVERTSRPPDPSAAAASGARAMWTSGSQVASVRSNGCRRRSAARRHWRAARDSREPKAARPSGTRGHAPNR